MDKNKPPMSWSCGYCKQPILGDHCDCQNESTPGSITLTDNPREHNIGISDYAKHKIQPWDIWLEYKLDPWEADIIKRILRDKPGERILDFQKIKHICDEKIRQLEVEDGKN